jgi:2-polyprenyl-3-methyl-5-hydroxy-6-metoxy-1,4-benzoquinol methylase
MLNSVDKKHLRQTCPYCGGDSQRRLTASDWNQHSVTMAFTYCKCNVCSLTFIQPLPEDIKHFYVREQYSVPVDADNFDIRAKSQAWKLPLLTPYIDKGNMLEVGPATGEFATVARDAGFTLTLIEMDSNCCAFLREALHHHVIQTDNPAIGIPQDQMFDVICVWQTIEHIPKFWQFLEAAAQRLRQGGVIALSTPNPDSFQARLMGRYWPHADVPRHLYLISPKWFEQTCKSFGLRVAMITTRDEGSLGLNYYGWFLWVRNWFGNYLSREKTDLWAARLTKWCKRWEHREGQGCSYVAILVKVGQPVTANWDDITA